MWLARRAFSLRVASDRMQHHYRPQRPAHILDPGIRAHGPRLTTGIPAKGSPAALLLRQTLSVVRDFLRRTTSRRTSARLEVAFYPSFQQVRATRHDHRPVPGTFGSFRFVSLCFDPIEPVVWLQTPQHKPLTVIRPSFCFDKKTSLRQPGQPLIPVSQAAGASAESSRR